MAGDRMERPNVQSVESPDVFLDQFLDILPRDIGLRQVQVIDLH
jgi:hypothetical protein